jgi:hypothetical protein
LRLASRSGRPLALAGRIAYGEGSALADCEQPLLDEVEESGDDRQLSSSSAVPLTPLVILVRWAGAV